MSLFRKPKKIQRRMFCADDDEDGDPEPPPPPVISRLKKETKSAKNTPLLSFADEEEDDGEVFKVKKSSQSKKLAKRREKEKQKQTGKPDTDNNTFDTNGQEEKNHTESQEEKPRKKITLEGLILSGREALAADGAGDLSPEESGGEQEEDERGFHRYRAESVRAALAGAQGSIPDAALIHAARKTRQQARELGGDFIPIKTDNGPGSRLVRDDGSGDDEEEGRILVRGLDLPTDKPKRGTAAASDEELGSEPDEWEAQQLQKARPALADVAADSGVDVNPFSVALPSVQLTAPPEYLRPLAEPGAPPPASAQDLCDALNKRLQELQEVRQSTLRKHEEVQERLLRSARVRESRAARCSELDAAYRRAQAVRGFLTDLIECLDEKMPQLEALEARALMMHKRRCEFLIERRRADVRDQAQDVLALVGRTGLKPVESEEKTRRAAEREGRRRARRLQRETAAAAAGAALQHRDGDSSDDELPPREELHHAHERDAIRQQAMALFADALPAWRGVRGVCGRLASWRAKARGLYADAYVADCLPKLLAPYVRHQLILWNPLADEDNEDYEKMDWYKCLMMYGVRSERTAGESSDSASGDDEESLPQVTEESVREDPDLMLVPTIVNRVVLPKVTELVEAAWDPVRVRSSVRLRQCVVRAAAGPGGGAALRRLAHAVRARLAAALAADVFLPTLPPAVLEGVGGVFWRRCLGAGVRLLRAALALAAPPPLLRADPLVLSLIETLCMGAGAASGPCMAQAAQALGASLPRGGPLRAKALRRLAALAQRALAQLREDNPLHLKSLEQARSVIAEARALE